MSSHDLVELNRKTSDIQSMLGRVEQRTRPTDQRVPDIVRAAAVMFIAKSRGQEVETVLAERYPKNGARISSVLRSAMQPAQTAVAGWAAELSASLVGPLLLSANAPSAFTAIAARSLQVDVSGAASLRLPTRAGTARINGSFVGEGQPIPVRRFGLSSVTLTPKKMSVISEYTRELMRHSTPTIESVVRTIMEQDTALAIDTALLDNVPADTIRPAGLLNGAVSVTPSSATPSSEAARQDIMNVIAAVTTLGTVPSPVLLVHPARAAALALASSALAPMVVASGAVPLTRLIGIDCSALAVALSDGATLDTSEAATLHEEDTAPLPIVGGVAQPPVIGSIAAPVRSLWQTASIGVRMRFDASWVARSAAVAVCDPVSW